MKRKVLAAAGVVAALAFSGYAAAQAPGDNDKWANQMGDQRLSAQQQAVDREAMAEFRQSCAPDRARLCSDKSSKAVGRCLEYHRLKLNSSCKQALIHLELAQKGAL